MFAPNTAAMAAGRGNAPEATSAIIAVVLKLELCQSSVIIIPPINI